MQSVLSPWAETFDAFARSVHRSAIIVAPFITEQPLQRFASLLHGANRPQVNLLTNLATDSLLQGSLDATAIAEFCRAFPTTTVRHLPGLHAKVYVADDHTAIITSGNLTNSSLYHNYEYGIQVRDPSAVLAIARDVTEYGGLGAQVSLAELDHLAGLSEVLRNRYANTLKSARTRFRKEFEEQLETTTEALRQLRGKPGESTNSIFSRTILYLLRKGPLTTEELHPLISNIHPDLCDDRVERVINGVRFGREWKHRVRSAQGRLKRNGLIELTGSEWRLVSRE